MNGTRPFWIGIRQLLKGIKPSLIASRQHLSEIRQLSADGRTSAREQMLQESVANCDQIKSERKKTDGKRALRRCEVRKLVGIWQWK